MAARAEAKAAVERARAEAVDAVRRATGSATSSRADGEDPLDGDASRAALSLRSRLAKTAADKRAGAKDHEADAGR